MDNQPILCVCLITYNQQEFIAQAIESVIQQDFPFSWELLIADDFSSDGTREILRDYNEKYPKFIRLILQERNVGPARNWLDLITTPKSKYIAYFEGDDYWIDSSKLSRQITFMEANPNCVLTFHDIVTRLGDNLVEPKSPIQGDRSYKGIVQVLQTHIPSVSVVFRNIIKTYPNTISIAPFGDKFLWGMLSQYGSFVKLDFVGAVYRRHDAGLWTRLKHIEKIEKRIKTYLLLAQVVNERDAQAVIRLSRKKAITGAAIAAKAFNLKALGFFLQVLLWPQSVR